MFFKGARDESWKEEFERDLEEFLKKEGEE
jgi:hypothetical protein